MSDEATITASSMLSSVLGATSENAMPSQPVSEQIGLLGESDSVPNTFRQILNSNLDAEGNASGAGPLVTPFVHTGELAVMSNDFNRHLSQFPSNLAATDLSLGGSKMPTSGSSLPLDGTIPTPAAGSQNPQLFGNALLSSGAEQPNPLQADKIDPRLANLTKITDDLADTPNTPNTPNTDEALAALSLASSSPTVAAPIADQSSTRSRDLTASGSSTGFADNTLEPNADASFTEDMGFDQQGRSSRNAQENPSELRSAQGPTAEFALDTPRRGDFQANLSATPTGELSSASLPPLNQLTSTGPAVASTTLTLVADRQLAGQQIAQHVASFVRQGDDVVEINLSPPHLGKISARIMLQNDQASVVLTAPSADIRELIEASLPKLGSLLEDAGLTLAEANVSSQDQGGNAEEHANDTPHGNASSAPQDTAIAAPQQLLRGLLDAYA